MASSSRTANMTLMDISPEKEFWRRDDAIPTAVRTSQETASFL